MNTRHFDIAIAALWLSGFFFSLPVIEPYELARLAAIACLFAACVMAIGSGLSRPEGLRLPGGMLRCWRAQA
jgi:hypothetical protein